MFLGENDLRITTFLASKSLDLRVQNKVEWNIYCLVSGLISQNLSPVAPV